MKVETLCNLGTVQHRLQRKDKARETLTGALDMMNNLGNSVSHSHPLRSTVLIAVGRLLLDMGDVDKGGALFDKGVDIRVETCGEFHPNIAAYFELKGREELREQGNSGRLRDAIQIYFSLIKRESLLSADHGISLNVLEDWRRKVKDLESLM